MKMTYIPPKVVVHRVILEKGIASTTSPAQAVTVEEWEPDPDAGNNGNESVWLPF
ncbi:MAG: hypothetical protein LBS46_02445 [Dysgonamonadaceae bacterium]|jgi:hypothetical protein|nr:hypothetical protein [Dysgonamonadaceae bacterium]